MGRYTAKTYFINPAHEDIARSRYYLKDAVGAPVEQDIFESFTRVNDYIYQNDDTDKRDLAQALCEDKKIMYAGRPLAQAGTGIKNMFNCFVLGIGDSREEISEAQRIHFHIQAHGGGTGINFSSLRPSGSWCKGANARSSGPEGFITAMGYLSSNIQQGGNRCLPGDVRISMADGSYKNIDQVRPGDKVLAFDKKLRKAVPSTVVNFFENGAQDIYEYSLTGGKTVRSTDTHRWLGIQTDGSLLTRTIKDMPKSSTKVGFIQDSPFFGSESSEWSPVLGYLLGDGCFTGDQIADGVNFYSVKETKYLGVELTYCIEIDHPDHLFIADGAISHNSGANMGILNDTHPGLLKFITKKSRSNWENLRKFAVITDENKFKQWQWSNPYPWQTFNVSVALSDEFMRQAKRQMKKEWKLEWDGVEWSLWDYELTMEDHLANGDSVETVIPITVCAPNEEIALHEAMNEVPFRNTERLELKNGPYHLTAYDWFRRICTNAWEDGCPGIFFVDKARAYHNGEYFNPLDATNPCVTADTMIHTSEGLLPVKDLIGTPFKAVVDGELYDSYKGFFPTGYRQVGVLSTKEGYSLRLTPDHKVLCLGGQWVPASELRPGDKMVLNNVRSVYDCETDAVEFGKGWLLGELLGDGYFHERAGAVLNFWGTTKLDMLELATSRLETLGGPAHYNSQRTGYSVDDRDLVGISSVRLSEEAGIRGLSRDKTLTASFLRENLSFKRGFLRGWFDADGSVQGSQNKGVSVRLWSVREDNLRIAQQSLLELGITSSIYPRRLDASRAMPDGKGGEKFYSCQPAFELVISNEDLFIFRDLVGFEDINKSAELDARLDSYKRTPNATKFTATVSSYELTSKEDVFDCTVEEVHRFGANGLTVHNCAEQVLPPWSVCCLSSVVLPEFVQEDGSVDWDGLKESVFSLVRGLNWITLLNKTDVEKIDENTQRERRIGLGTIGMHEMLIRMSMRGDKEYIYSQDTGRAMAKRVLKFIKHAAYEASIDMAKEIGPFPAYDFEKFKESKFIQQLLKERPDLEEELRVHGIANVTILTQAPTGTTGTITGYSSGCEPYFAMAYQRNSNVGTIMDGCPSFLEWMEGRGIDFGEYNHDFKELKRHKRVPKYFEQAQDISWQDHLAMQAVFAEQVDSSVSKCLSEGTLINTNYGLIPIEQCGDARGEDVFGNPVPGLMVIDESGKHQKVLSHYSAGEKEATRITLQNGASICGSTTSHKVKTVGGWKTLGELVPDDLVFVNDEFEVLDAGNALPIDIDFDRNTSANPVKLPEKMSVYLAKLLGMLVADGHLEESTGKVSLYEKSGLGGFYDSLAEDLFGVRPEVHEDPRTGVIEHRITSRVLVRYLRNLIGYRCDDKKVPEQILRGSFAEKQDFIEGLTLDGYLRPGRGLVVYEGKSELLAYQTAEMLRSFGVPRVYCGKKLVKTHDYYVYSVMVSEKLQEVIVPLELHKCSVPCYRKRNQLVTFSPEDLETLPVTAPDGHYSAIRNLRQKERDYCTQSLANEVGLEITGKVEKISTIEHLGKISMYDIEVEDSHNYLVSGIVSHNTINLPSEATVDDIMGAYIGAFDANIKSTTVYRDGSKTQILETLKNPVKNTEARPQTVVTMRAPERPDELDCDIYTVSVKGEKWKVLVGLLHGRPYEIFCFPEEHIEISSSRHEGLLQRNGHGRYNLVIGTGEDTWTIKNVAQLLLSDEHRMITRLLSTSLRHGAPLNALVSQLTKCDGEVTAFSKAILRVLKKYITDEEYLEVSRCRSCGSKDLEMKEGCLSCAQCGFSGCD